MTEATSANAGWVSRVQGRATAFVAIIAIAATLSACGTSTYVLREQPSTNQDGRVRHLILHYTSEDTDESLRLLTQPSSNPVSSHYLVDRPDGRRGNVRVYRLVPESARAWHAGRSHWLGETALNASSIGIEIVNESACTPQETLEGCAFTPYPPEQIDAVIALCQEILARHPDIEPWRVLAHSDIAPSRRVDPGPQFPWRALHEAGVGAWYDEDAAERWRGRFEANAPSLPTLQRALIAWGFDLEPTGAPDDATRDAVRALQLHFRPTRHDGRIDTDTSAILFALLERYRPQTLDTLR
ncbi:MAG: N-acetylmuramoyl-L-alanine amidase [Pseudomonadota bacterium]